ncbi:MAG: hypothetical protein ACRC2S_28595 [Waterburya sp.]
MNLTEIVSAIQKSGMDKAEELAQALTDHVNGLKSDHEGQVNKLSKQIENLTSAIGVDSGTTEERLNSAGSKVKNLTADLDALIAEKENLTKQLTQNQKQQLIKQAADTSKASAVVLERLISDEEVKVEGSNVTVAGTPLKDWAETNHPAFISALFPEIKLPKLPNTPPHNNSQVSSHNSQVGEDKPKSAWENHSERFYKKPEFAI